MKNQNDPLSDNIPHSGLNESKVDSNEGEPDKYKPRRSQRSWKPTSEILESFVFANEISEENNSKAMLKVLPTPMLELVMQSSDEKSYGDATSYPPRGGMTSTSHPPRGGMSSTMCIKDVVPDTFEQAMNSTDRHLWLQAIDSEILSHITNGTLLACDLPKGRKAVPLSWVFKIKIKARIVMKKIYAKGRSRLS